MTIYYIVSFLQDYDQFDRIVLDLARVKAWSFARPVIKNNRMAFTDCGAAYLRHGGIIHHTLPDWSAMGGGGIT
jgi:hypothetical protein